MPPAGLNPTDTPVLRLVIANRSRHHDRRGNGGVYSFLAGGSFDEIGAGHHGHDAGARDIFKRLQFAGCQNHFHQLRLAGRLERGDFVVERLPVGL